MKEVLIHYGVKGMKWGVRKQYEAAGGGGGGGWGPNNPVGGNPLAAAATSVPNNPKGKKIFGKNAAKQMGIQDNAKKEAEARRKKGEADAEALSKALALGTAYEELLNSASDNGATIGPELLKEYNRLTNDYLLKSKAMEKNYGFISSDIVTDNGRDYVYTLMMDKDFTEVYEGLAEIKYDKSKL